MTDVFTPYERGLETLLIQLGKEHTRYQEVLVYQQRLYENLTESRMYGDSQGLRNDRARIIAQLNQVALTTLGVDSNGICGPKATLVAMEIGRRQFPRPREYTRFRAPVFVGRRAELEALPEALKQSQAIGLYALRGMGGVGKSALAAELAARLDDPERFPGGILWANLAEESPSLVAARWLGNYGYDASRDSETARLSRLVLGTKGSTNRHSRNPPAVFYKETIFWRRRICYATGIRLIPCSHLFSRSLKSRLTPS